MKRRVIRIAIVMFFALLPVWRAWLLTPAEVEVRGAEYQAGAVLVRVYEDEALPGSYWVLMGTGSDDARLTLLDGEGEAIVSTTGYADARPDGTVRVRIDQLHLGILWWPESLVTFALPADGLPLRTPENAAGLAAEFQADLGR